MAARELMVEINNSNNSPNSHSPNSDDNNSLHQRYRSRSPILRTGVSRMDRLSGSGGQDSTCKIRLIVSNIPFEARWQDIKDLYKEKVSSDGCFAEIIENSDGKSSGSAVIEVRGRELADKTIAALSECEMRGRKLYVREERERDRERMQNQKRMSADHRGVGGMNGSGPMLSGRLGGGMYGGGGMNSLPPGCMQLLLKLNIDPECITNQIFIANLEYKVTSRKLTEVFGMAGNILQVDIKTDKEGNSRGMATVRFENPIEAVQAVAMFNNQYLYDRQMNVRMDRMAESTQQLIPNKLPSGLRCFGMGLGEGGQPLMNIGQIANFVTLSNLSSLISGSGNAMGGMSGMGSGFGGGFNSLMATLAGSMNNFGSNMGGGAGWGSGAMDMGQAGLGMGSMMGRGSMGGGRSSDPQSSTTLLVKNLPFSTTWQELKDRFKQIGDVKYAEIKMESGRSKGYGTVKFATVEEARRAIAHLNGTLFESRQIEVRFE